MLPKRRVTEEKKAMLVNFGSGVNTALLALSEWETRLIHKTNLPFGVSVVCVAEKKALEA